MPSSQLSGWLVVSQQQSLHMYSVFPAYAVMSCNLEHKPQLSAPGGKYSGQQLVPPDCGAGGGGGAALPVRGAGRGRQLLAEGRAAGGGGRQRQVQHAGIQPLHQGGLTG